MQKYLVLVFLLSGIILNAGAQDFSLYQKNIFVKGKDSMP